MKYGRKQARSSAFSLVEVTMALGIASFCLIAILALLPAGLSSVRNANEEAAAAAVLGQMHATIRNACRTPATNAEVYAALSPYTNLIWTNGGVPVTFDLTNLSHGGGPDSEGMNKRFRARVQITPPVGTGVPGTALLSIAWPPEAQWNSGSNSWQRAQGSLTTWQIFLPRP